MIITDDDIRYAESILLDESQSFDDERRRFIKNMETIDLQAVPGSGKTTALLAKLLIIESKLPLENGAGILVLSHTNTAIDEIKDKIQNHCPKLFAYPNFIGTIQSFVDSFLALPFYNCCYAKKVLRIDNEIYDEIALHFYYSLQSRSFGTYKWLDRKSNSKDYFLNLRVDEDDNLVIGLNGNIALKNKGEKSSNSYTVLKSIKDTILEMGYLHFDDAYILADRSIASTGILEVLRKRFSFIFVDEMQDMGHHQYRLIEKLFYENECSSILQRIGDINQAIYSADKSSSNFIWQQRESTLPLANSHRLSPSISNIVNRFAINAVTYDVKGNNYSATLRPHILCFNDATIKEVIPFFSRLVNEYRNEGKLPNFGKRPIKAIAWNVDWKEDEKSREDISKLRLEDYANSFNSNTHRPKIDYKCLKEYLVYCPRNVNTLAPIRNSILNAFIKILRIEDIRDNSLDNPRFYTKRKLLSELKERNLELYDKFKLKIYQWSIDIVEDDIDSVLESMRSFTSELLGFFECPINKCREFIQNEYVRETTQAENTIKTNFYNNDGFNIEIASVHSVKGQTHCATLYLESYYKSKYESERLKSKLTQKGRFEESDINQTTLKMIYVGFSRPMDLLCFAVHEDRLNPLRDVLESEWEIIDVFHRT